ncbi:hypothetical protein BDC45DRAFT_570538 [Circinella umbellata]|nr:hypothetical protein BDC45DRAFT_570538 [Circinella umbellata]
MWIGKLFVLGVLGAASVNAQLTNSTLLGILNTTQLAPSGKFMELLKSDKSFNPIIQLLSNPGNHTLFIPTDQAIQDLTDQSQSNGDFNDNVPQNSSSSSSSNSTSSSGSGSGSSSGSGKDPEVGGSGSEPPPPEAEGGGDQQQQIQENTPVVRAIFARDLTNLQSNSTNSTNSTSGGGGGNSTQQQNNLTASTVPFKQGPYANLTVLNLIQYHILKGEYILKDLNDTNVFHTTLTNKTLDKNGNGLAIVVNQQNETGSSDQSSQDSGDQEQQQQIRQLADQQQNSTNSTGGGGNNNQTAPPVPKKYVVGNGVDFANVTIKNIEASNGVLNFIDKGKYYSIGPPGKPTSVIQNVSDTQTLAQLVQQHNDTASQVNNAHNITIFIPSDQALSDANLGSSSVQIMEGLQNLQAQPNNIQQLIKDHIVPGVYYAENLTEIAKTSGNHSIKNLNNDSLPLTYVNATSVKVNNTATVIEPNILTNNGVMHVIDKVLGEQGSQQQQGGQDQGQQQGGQDQGQQQGGQDQGQQQGGQDQGQQQGGQDQGQQQGGQDQGQQQGGQDQGQQQGGQDQGQQQGGQDQGQQQGGQDQGQQQGGQDQGQQ